MKPGYSEEGDLVVLRMTQDDWHRYKHAIHRISAELR